MNTSSTTKWVYLDPKPGSVYRQLFIKGRNIAARTIYGCAVREEDPMTPEEIAADYGLPLDAVLEAIAYCQSDPPEIREDWEREEANMRAMAREPEKYPYYRHPAMTHPPAED